MKKGSKKVAKKVEQKVAPTYVNGFVFTGNGSYDPAWISKRGYLFELNGRVVEVTDEVAAKLRTHSHFTEK